MRILIAPLDWGLGHAARCIPIIRMLRDRGAEVLLAGEGRGRQLLESEFPQLRCLTLPGLHVTYPRKLPMAIAMIARLPGIVRTSFREHRSLANFIRRGEVDAVISDGRFGLFSPEIPSVYVTHQLSIAAPPPFRFVEPFMRRIHRSLINRYTECWIADTADENGLAGRLSHGATIPSNAHYIGWLSRFAFSGKRGPDYDVTVVLSGPEPQRSYLEQILQDQLKTSTLRSIMIRGVPEEDKCERVGNLELVSHRTSDELQRLLLSSKIIISRPGYSSLMDLARIGGRAILIPTPGQTEQEYLGRLMMERGIAYCTPQRSFNLHEALNASAHYRGLTPTPESDELEKAVSRLLEKCGARTR